MGIFRKKPNDVSPRDDGREKKHTHNKTDYTPPSAPPSIPTMMGEIDRDRASYSDENNGKNGSMSKVKDTRNTNIASEDSYCVTKVNTGTMEPAMRGDAVVVDIQPAVPGYPVRDSTSRTSSSESAMYSSATNGFINILQDGVEMTSFKNDNAKGHSAISATDGSNTNTLKYMHCPDDEHLSFSSMNDGSTVRDKITILQSNNSVDRASIVFEKNKKNQNGTRIKLTIQAERGPYVMRVASIVLAAATIFCTLFALTYIDRFNWDLSDWINAFYSVMLSLLILLLEVPVTVECGGIGFQFLSRLRFVVVEDVRFLKFERGRGCMFIVAGSMNLSVGNARLTFYAGVSQIIVGALTVLEGAYACHRLRVFEKSFANNNSFWTPDGTGESNSQDNGWINRDSFARWGENIRFQLGFGSSRVGEALRGVDSDWWGDINEKSSDTCGGEHTTTSATTAGIGESPFRTSDAAGKPKDPKDKYQVVV